MKRYHAIALTLTIPLALAHAAPADTIVPCRFVQNQSTVHLAGGLIGINETYPVQGEFEIRIDEAQATAIFQAVNATYDVADDLADRFSLPDLTGTVVDANTITFVGASTIHPHFNNPPLMVHIEATFQGDLVHLTGGYDESTVFVSDGFAYALDATATVIPEPASVSLLAAASALLLAAGKKRMHGPHTSRLSRER